MTRPDAQTQARMIRENGYHGRLSRWRACDVGKAPEGLKNKLWRRWSDGKVGEWAELRHSSFFNPSSALPTSQLILQPFRRFTYVTARSPNFPSLYLSHSSFYNLSITSPTSQLILQPFCCFTYVTAHSPTLLSLLLRHRLFTYVTWRAAHVGYNNNAETDEMKFVEEEEEEARENSAPY